MSRIVAGVCAAALLSGCATYRTSQQVAEAGGSCVLLGLGGGLILVLAAGSSPGADPDSANSVGRAAIIGGASLVALGIVLGIAGYVGMSRHDEPPSLPASAPDTRAPRRERAWRLTQQAEAAARAGNCELVAIRDHEVRALDEEFHSAVFMRDVGIRRCLDARAATAPAPSTDQPAASNTSVEQTR